MMLVIANLSYCLTRVEGLTGSALLLITEELEAAVAENASLRGQVARGGALKEQLGQLLERLKHARTECEEAAAQRDAALADAARLQQRVCPHSTALLLRSACAVIASWRLDLV